MPEKQIVLREAFKDCVHHGEVPQEERVGGDKVTEVEQLEGLVSTKAMVLAIARQVE